MIIRPEEPADYQVIAGLIGSAMTPIEVKLVELIRASENYVPDLALIAEDDSAVVGHIMFSYVALLDSEELRVLALAPMAVIPDRQRQGIGGALVTAGLEKAELKGEPLVNVLGHADYYPRFGFEPARPLGIDPPWPELEDEVWMAKRLSAYTHRYRGTVKYPPAFDVT